MNDQTPAQEGQNVISKNSKRYYYSTYYIYD